MRVRVRVSVRVRARARVRVRVKFKVRPHSRAHGQVPGQDAASAWGEGIQIVNVKSVEGVYKL